MQDRSYSASLNRLDEPASIHYIPNPTCFSPLSTYPQILLIPSINLSWSRVHLVDIDARDTSPLVYPSRTKWWHDYGTRTRRLGPLNNERVDHMTEELGGERQRLYARKGFDVDDLCMS
jgi:hypothetical protein